MKWYCRTRRGESGPLSLEELVAMVRAGMLTGDDLVRVEEQDAWRPAETVVGLFYLAKRCGSLESQAEQRTQEFAPEELGDLLNQAEPVEAVPSGDPEPLTRGGDEKPAWHRRMVEIAMQRKISLPSRTSTRAPRAPAPSSSRVSLAIHATTTEITWKDATRKEGQRRPQFSIHAIFRVAIVLLVANLTGLGIVRWTEREAKRFPDITSQARHFPLRGKCSPTEYLFLLTGTMNLAGLTGYGLSKYLNNT